MNYTMVVIANIIEVFVIQIYWFGLLKTRFSKDKALLVFYAVTFLNIVKNCMMLDNVTAKSVTTILVMILLIGVLFVDSWYKKSIVIVIQNVSSMLAEMLGILIAKYVLRHDMVNIMNGGIKTLIWQIIVCLLMIIFSIIGLMLLKRKKIDPDKRSTQLLFLYIALQMLVLFIVVMLIFEEAFSFELCMMVIFVMVSALFIGYFILVAVKNISKEALEAEFMKLELKMKNQHFYEMKEECIKYKRLKHDLFNHLSVMDEIKDLDKFREYSQSVKAAFKQIEEITYCNNPTLDAILSLKRAEAEKNNITVDYIIGNCDNISISDFDLCTILGNLFDNAIRAAGQTTDRKIHLEIGKKLERFLIKMQNSSMPVNEKLQTTKKDKDNHGVGMENIKLTVDKYDGITVFKYQDGVFTSLVSLIDNAMTEN